MAAHSGLRAPQSAQRLLLGSTQMRSATSRFDKASPIASRMASTHCSRSCSDSAIKLRMETNARPSVKADMTVSITATKWQIWDSLCLLCLFPYAHEPTEHWLLLCSHFTKYIWAKTGNYTHKHTHRQVCGLTQTRVSECFLFSSVQQHVGHADLKIHKHTHMNTHVSENAHLNWDTHWHTVPTLTQIHKPF